MAEQQERQEQVEEVRPDRRPWSIGEVAKWMRVTPNTIAAWVRQGRFPAADFNPGRRGCKWLPATLDRWASERSRKA